MSYEINARPVGNQPSFSYFADTHPAVGEHIYLRNDKFKVIEVTHVLNTTDKRISDHTFAYVELIVVLT